MRQDGLETVTVFAMFTGRKSGEVEIWDCGQNQP
jgi:hypothetical protein